MLLYIRLGIPAEKAVTDLGLNRLCNIEDWNDPELVAAIQRLLPHFVRAYPGFPTKREHRKHWEYAHVVTGLEQLGAVRPDSWLLSVAGGHEEPAYELTNHVRWMFLVDLYGAGGFKGAEAQETVLTNPDAFETVPYNRNRLVVQYMNALDLRFEESTFDGAFCLSSVEHFGGFIGAVKGLQEMHRVLKPGGIAAITTECIVNGQPALDVPGLMLFTPELIEQLSRSVPGLEPVEPISFSISESSLATAFPLERAIEGAKTYHTDYPHIVVELQGRYFTSVALFFCKTG
jgi:SAM-dependent methyltransferase